MKTFFTADTHFYHNNIIRLSNRPFSNVEEMNEVLINNWNRVVDKTDEVYHLGDFSWAEYYRTQEILKRLNGKIHFTPGNHDQVIMDNMNLRNQFASINQYLEKDFILDDINGFKRKMSIKMFHYPMLEWNGMYRGAYHLHGHTHGNVNPDAGFILDVGVDGALTDRNDPTSYRPIELKEVYQYMQTRKKNHD